MSIPPKLLLDGLLDRGASLITGVPCSFLTPLMNEAVSRDRGLYLPASSEGEALATAAGSWLGGGLGVVLCQNSGLGNMVNPITSLTNPFKTPALILVTWRGQPDHRDEPQHELMGHITTLLLDLLGLQWAFAPPDAEALDSCLDAGFAAMARTGDPYAIVISQGDLEPGEQLPPPHRRLREPVRIEAPLRETSAYPTRTQALQEFVAAVPREAAVITTTGMCGRELFTLGDRNQNLYCVGSMGYASAFAHGLSLTTDRRVYVLDGDGAAIMHMGNFATIAARGAANFIHIILDNGTYDSTGGQPTVSNVIDFVQIALACGYAAAMTCQSLEQFKEMVQSPLLTGPCLIHLRIQPGTPRVGRPNVSPAYVARRMRRFMTGQSPPLESDRVGELHVQAD